jgi:DNA-binding transcriptional regulator YhcF (GntR family)
MQKALTLLENEGLLYSQGTVGRFVTDDTAILGAARENIKLETVRRLLSDAYSVGISPSELIQYIQKEETDK